jgi:hypothetical protein
MNTLDEQLERDSDEQLRRDAAVDAEYNVNNTNWLFTCHKDVAQLNKRLTELEETVLILSKNGYKVAENIVEMKERAGVSEEGCILSLLIKERLDLMRNNRLESIKPNSNQAYMKKLDDNIESIDRLIRAFNSNYK